MNWTLVAIMGGGGVGAVLRFLTDHFVPRPLLQRFPWGTTGVNVLGSFLLGLIVGMNTDEPLAAILGTGLLGGYTTFSTASLASVRLLEERRYTAALISSAGMWLATVAAALTGLLLTSATV